MTSFIANRRLEMYEEQEIGDNVQLLSRQYSRIKILFFLGHTYSFAFTVARIVEGLTPQNYTT